MASKENNTMETKVTRKQMVLDTLLQAKRAKMNNGFVSGHALEAVAGPTALRRLRELRAEGYQIEMRREGRTVEYRLTRVKPVVG
jgi:hypothetical protein